MSHASSLPHTHRRWFTLLSAWAVANQLSLAINAAPSSASSEYTVLEVPAGTSGGVVPTRIDDGSTAYALDGIHEQLFTKRKLPPCEDSTRAAEHFANLSKGYKHDEAMMGAKRTSPTKRIHWLCMHALQSAVRAVNTVQCSECSEGSECSAMQCSAVRCSDGSAVQLGQ